MSFIDLAKTRYSVRKFKQESVPQEIIDKILEAARIAPTGCNNQPQRIIVVNSQAGLEKLYKCTKCHFNAPLVFIISHNKKECWHRPYDKKSSGDIDASIVTTHIMLEAWENGVGSCWVMHYDPAALKEAFALEDDLESTALLVCGFPADDAEPMALHEKSKPLSDFVKYE